MNSSSIINVLKNLARRINRSCKKDTFACKNFHVGFDYKFLQTILQDPFILARLPFKTQFLHVFHSRHNSCTSSIQDTILARLPFKTQFLHVFHSRHNSCTSSIQDTILARLPFKTQFLHVFHSRHNPCKPLLQDYIVQLRSCKNIA